MRELGDSLRGIFFRGGRGSVKAPDIFEKIGPILLQEVGEIQYDPTNKAVWERVIAGGAIPDSQRVVFTDRDENSAMILPFLADGLSGKMGFIDYQVIRPSFYQANLAGSVYIAHLGIEPDFRGKGIGEQLVHAVEHIAKTKEINLITTHASSEPGVRLMRKLGYIEKKQNLIFCQVIGREFYTKL